MVAVRRIRFISIQRTLVHTHRATICRESKSCRRGSLHTRMRTKAWHHGLRHSLTRALERFRSNGRIDRFHPLPTALILVKLWWRLIVRWIQNPMFASVQGFGKARSVYMPLDARAAVANAKTERDGIGGARFARRQLVTFQQSLPVYNQCENAEDVASTLDLPSP